MMLTLYDYYRSTAAYRVRIALNLKKIPYEKIPIHLVKDGGQQYLTSYSKINPQQLVPTLVVDDHVLTQSLAIIEYLEERYPQPPLLPKDAYARAWVRSLAMTIACDMHPLNNLRVLKYLTNTLGVSEEEKLNWYHHWLQLGFTALEKRIESNYAGHGVCFEKQITLADICLIPQLYNAKRFNFSLEKFPTLQAIDHHCLQLDAFAEPIDES